jgi:hypothetical protein
LIYVTYPGIEAVQIGIKIKQKYKIPLIVEFRDSLVEDPLMRRNYFQKRNAIHEEKKAICFSDKIITVTESLATYLNNKYKIDKALCVYNGYFEEDFPSSSLKKFPNVEKNETIKLLHLGSICGSRDREVESLYAALSSINKKYNVFVDFYGNLLKKEYDLIQYYNLQDKIRVFSPVNRFYIYNTLIYDYDYLLYYGVPNSRFTIGSKIYEYMNASIPIIGFCEENEIKDILVTSQTGNFFGYSKQEIINGLEKGIRREVLFNPNKKNIENFSRKNQAIQIAKIIIDTIETNKNRTNE